jgi:UDP-2,3-diacylglucosamine pyrophosphatase LpxH
MTSYSILVIDDQPGQTKKLFENLFKGDARFNFDQAQTRSEFENANIDRYDAILLDINLSHWGMFVSDALAIIGKRSPVVLVSREWNSDQTHSQITKALAEAKEIKFIATMMLNNLIEADWENYAASMRFQLIAAIGRERRTGFLDLAANASVCILHLSDTQYGDPSSEEWAAYVEDQIAQFLLRDGQREIHFIAITGDISFSGEIDQYEKAEKKLTKLIQRFLPNRSDWRERILLVPGNHDVNLRLAAADKINIKIENTNLSIKNRPTALTKYPHRRFALAPFRDFASRLTGDPRWRDSDELNWINDSFRHIGLRFYLLNSTSTIDCDHPKKAGFLHEAIDELGSDDLIHEQPFGIAFSHHGAPEITDTADDILSNWAKVAPFLTTRGVRLFIHGHGHERKVDRFDLSEQTTRLARRGTLGDREILRIMAPTTHLNEKLRPEGEVRGFNLITLCRTHGKVTSVKVESYETSKSNSPTPSKDSPWEYQVS